MLWFVKDPSKIPPDSVPKIIEALSIALQERHVIPTSVFLLMLTPDFCKYLGSTIIFLIGTKLFLAWSKFHKIIIPSKLAERMKNVLKEVLESKWVPDTQLIVVILSLCPCIDPTPEDAIKESEESLKAFQT